MAYPRPSQPNGVQHYDIEHYETAMGTAAGRITSCTGRSCPTPGWFVVTLTGVLRHPDLGTVTYYPTVEAALDAYIASLT